MGEIRSRKINPDEDPRRWARTVCGHRSRTPAQIARMGKIRTAGIELIAAILENCDASADRSTAVRKAREALMFAEQAVDLSWD